MAALDAATIRQITHRATGTLLEPPQQGTLPSTADGEEAGRVA